jgi:hypothetical protein
MFKNSYSTRPTEVCGISFMNLPPPLICAASRYLAAVFAVLYGSYSLYLSVANSQNLSRIPQYTQQ